MAGFLSAGFAAGFGLTFGMGFADQTRFNASLKGIAGDAASSFSEGFFMEEELMPQKLAEGYVLRSEPKFLRNKPEFAIGIALVANEWTQLEGHLLFAFSFCLFAMNGQGGTSGKVAEAAWYSIDGLNSRLKLLETIARQRIPESLLLEFKQTIIPEIRKRAGERNKIVHGNWTLCDKYPDDIILNTPDPEDRRRYSLKDFDQTIDRIIATSNLTANFWFKVRELTKPAEHRQLEQELQERLSQLIHPTQQDKTPPSPSEQRESPQG